jgi:hypothetical protein
MPALGWRRTAAFGIIGYLVSQAKVAMDISTSDRLLTGDDLPIVLDVLRASPALEATAYAVRLIEPTVGYPIESVASLQSLFREQDEIRLGPERTVNADQVGRFLPDECFPINDREELISRVLMAFERERMSVFAELPMEDR